MFLIPHRQYVCKSASDLKQIFKLIDFEKQFCFLESAKLLMRIKFFPVLFTKDILFPEENIMSYLIHTCFSFLLISQVLRKHKQQFYDEGNIILFLFPSKIFTMFLW